MTPSKTYRINLGPGMKGFDVEALQVNLKKLDQVTLFVNGIYDATTTAEVKQFQSRNNLLVDGYAGPRTQRKMASIWMSKARNAVSLPSGLLAGFCELESGFAVGAANFRQAGFVDLGWMQFHLPFPSDQNTYHSAIDGSICFPKAANILRTRKNQFYKGLNHVNDQRDWELAALAHSWPAGAKALYNGTGLSDQPAAWVQAIGAINVESPLDWANFYIAHVTKYVTKWSA